MGLQSYMCQGCRIDLGTNGGRMEKLLVVWMDWWYRDGEDGNVTMKGWRQSRQFVGDGWNEWVNDWDGEWIDDIGMEMNENVSMKGWRQSHQFGGDGWNIWINDWNGEWIDDIGMERDGYVSMKGWRESDQFGDDWVTNGEVVSGVYLS